ncbi:hypothetical protein [Aquimarina rhabdastrellae]
MNDKSLIIGTDSNNKEIDIETLEKWIQDIELNKEKIADMVYFRLFNRYLKPFDFKNLDYTKNYKNGFAIMANCCLLIETYISFTVKEFINTHNKSERCFGYFFVTESKFSVFASGGLKPEQYIDLSTNFRNKGKGIPKEFYSYVRCGILHNGETRKSWRIRRDTSSSLLQISNNSKIIQANAFLLAMIEVLKEYRKRLKSSAPDSELWTVCITRLKDLIKNS